MPIEDIRAKQKADQTKAIKSRLEAGSIVRIGNRLPITGRHEVLESDGGISNNGVKVYNAQEQYGDRVLAYPRLDGTIALDSEKGSIVRPPTAFPVCPGYLAGQVFNCEEPKRKKKGKIWVLYELNNKIYVGGHEEIPELLAWDPGVFINADTAQIWGDKEGWEATFAHSNSGFTSVAGTQVRQHATPNLGALYSKFLGKGIYRAGSVFMSGFESGGGLRYGPGPYPGSALLDVDATAIAQTGIKVFTESGGQTTVFDPIIGQMERSPYTSNSSATTPLPAPFSAKSENATEIINLYYYPPDRLPSTQKFTRSSSYESLFRDRSVFLFAKTSSENLRVYYYPDGSFNSFPQETVEYLISDGITDTTLFSLSFNEIKEYSKSAYNPDFGETEEYGINHAFALFGAGLRAQANSPYESMRNIALKDYKFNHPTATKFEPADRSALRSHLNVVKSYDVKVYDTRSKASLIDGEHTIVSVDAWGIPIDSRILDVAAWVP